MEYTSVYGYIKIDRDYDGSAAFLKTLGKDGKYPFINTNMFSFGDYEIPYYYENPIFSFAATYKYFGLDLRDWNDFIVKMENILRNIDFDSAQFHVESAVGNYTLFWQKKDRFYTKPPGQEEEYLNEYNLTKTDEWYFGFGRRSPFTGYPESDLKEYEDLRNFSGFTFTYPVKG